MPPLAQLDHRYVWHPFTQMRDWLKREPITILEGQGAVLRDTHGRKYLDANSSIWTNLHGHRHPRINRAVQGQLKKVAHTSALGLANEPASVLAARLVQAANPPASAGNALALKKVFFSDDGSTAMEVGLKLAYEYSRRRSRTRARTPKFLSLDGAYHGDTVGAVALGHIPLFHSAYAGLLFRTDAVMAPYCYRCPFNRAKPQRADAREYRECHWECLGKLEQKCEKQKKKGQPYAGFVFEPLIQGAAGMIAQPLGWLRRATEIVRAHGALLIADEVMTGFGRTGSSQGERFLLKSSRIEPMNRRRNNVPLTPALSPSAGERENRRQSIGEGRFMGRAGGEGIRAEEAVLPSDSLFACHKENVQPDLLALAKGLTGGYLPMAATLTTQAVFDAFLGKYEEFKTFFHGHSFTANQLGAAAALANMDILSTQASVRARIRLERALRRELQTLWSLSHVGDIRQVGLIAGVELVKDWRTREPFKLSARAGIRVCEAMAARGVLTRPVGNVIVLMPPYCTTDEQVRRMVEALRCAIANCLK